MLYNIGHDVEVPLVNPNGMFVSSIGKIGGSKKEPRILQSGTVQEDNVALELGGPPCPTEDAWVNHLKSLIKEVKGTIITPTGLDFLVQASAEYPIGELEHPNARFAGCEPDFTAWPAHPRAAFAQNDPPDLSGTTLRSFGGHIHLNIDHPEDEWGVQHVIRACDLHMGLVSVLLDEDVRRRSLYGKAGAFRFKPYGLEYRTLSNFWLKTEELWRWVYKAAVAATEHEPEVPDEVQVAINNSDKALAMDLIQEYGVIVP